MVVKAGSISTACLFNNKRLETLVRQNGYTDVMLDYISKQVSQYPELRVWVETYNPIVCRKEHTEACEAGCRNEHWVYAVKQGTEASKELWRLWRKAAGMTNV
jgi:hypothetical protein